MHVDGNYRIVWMIVKPLERIGDDRSVGPPCQIPSISPHLQLDDPNMAAVELAKDLLQSFRALIGGMRFVVGQTRVGKVKKVVLPEYLWGLHRIGTHPSREVVRGDAESLNASPGIGPRNSAHDGARIQLANF